jgi:hypothetical protein
MTSKTTPKKPSQLDRIENLLHDLARENASIVSKLNLLALKGSEIGEKEEPWVPVVGQPARCDGLIFVVEDHKRTVGEWWMIDSTWRPTHHLSKPSPAEVQKYEEQVKAQELAKVDELQEGDACRTSYEEVREVIDLSAPTFDTGKGHTILAGHPYLLWFNGKIKQARPDTDRAIEWLPFPEFRRRLEGTISKRKAQEQEAKIAHWRRTTLKWPQFVKYQDREAIVRDHHGKVGMNNNNGMGWVSLTFKEGDTNCVSPIDLTLIEP